MDHLNLPDTDSPEVMQQVISLWLTNVIWEENSRLVSSEDLEGKLLETYSRVYQAVRNAHVGGGH